MIESLGNIGDFIGGFGVVVTVVYLAYQIRQNTASTRSASYHSVVADISRWTLELGQNPEATSLYFRGLERIEDLSEEEQLQFSFLLGSLIRHFENIHFQYMAGAIDDSVWNGWSTRILGTFGDPGSRAWWESQKTAFSTEFQQYIDSAPEQAPKTYPFRPGAQAQRVDTDG